MSAIDSGRGLLAQVTADIEKLTALRDALQAIYGALDAADEVASAPAARRTTPKAPTAARAVRQARPSVEGKGSGQRAQILALLTKAPGMKVATLATAMRMEIPALKYHLKVLQASGEVVGSGATSQRTYAPA